MDKFENHVLLEFAFTNKKTKKQKQKAILGKIISYQDILLVHVAGLAAPAAWIAWLR